MHHPYLQRTQQLVLDKLAMVHQPYPHIRTHLQLLIERKNFSFTVLDPFSFNSTRIATFSMNMCQILCMYRRCLVVGCTDAKRR